MGPHGRWGALHTATVSRGSVQRRPNPERSGSGARMRLRGTSGIRVYLVDDEVLIRESLQVVLDLEPDIEVVGQASDGETVLNDPAARSADVVLMEVRLPGIDGIEATRRLKETVPGIAVVMLSSYDNEHVGAALDAGASRYILKSYERRRLVQAVRAASEGQMPIDPSLTGELVRELSNLRLAHRDSILTKRQMEILGLVALGSRYKEIARTLFVSESTINREMRKVYDGLGVKDAAHAVSEAWRRGLL